MKNTPRDTIHEQLRHKMLKDELSGKLSGLDMRQLEVLLDFVNNVVLCHDPEVVQEFQQWREDPTIGSILQIATSISGEMREQLLFAAEELFSTEAVRH